MGTEHICGALSQPVALHAWCCTMLHPAHLQCAQVFVKGTHVAVKGRCRSRRSPNRSKLWLCGSVAQGDVETSVDVAIDVTQVTRSARSSMVPPIDRDGFKRCPFLVWGNRHKHDKPTRSRCAVYLAEKTNTMQTLQTMQPLFLEHMQNTTADQSKSICLRCRR